MLSLIKRSCSRRRESRLESVYVNGCNNVNEGWSCLSATDCEQKQCETNQRAFHLFLLIGFSNALQSSYFPSRVAELRGGPYRKRLIDSAARERQAKTEVALLVVLPLNIRVGYRLALLILGCDIRQPTLVETPYLAVVIPLPAFLSVSEQ